MGHVQQKNALAHTRTEQVQINAKCLIRAFLSSDVFYSILWFYWQTAKTQIRQHILAVWSGPLPSAVAPKADFCMALPIS